MPHTQELSDGCGVQGTEAGPFRAVGAALEVIPRTLAQNCGANVIRTLTKLRAKHAEQEDCTFGIDGNTGKSHSAISGRRKTMKGMKVRSWHLDSGSAHMHRISGWPVLTLSTAQQINDCILSF